MDTDKLDIDIDDVLTLFNDIEEELLKEGTSCYNTLFYIINYTPHKQSLGGYIGIALSVRPCTL
jgi:hypothetical protein